jgi:hypothetical protein
MKLESEFRIRLQIQQLEECLRDRAVPLQPSTWVKLAQPPSVFSFDQALLLCLWSETQWLAWVPDYGEVVLDIDTIDAS